MKRFNPPYYLFIFASMVLSVIMAPTKFIERNAMVGWLWIFVFFIVLLFLLSEAIDKATVKAQKEQLFIRR